MHIVSWITGALLFAGTAAPASGPDAAETARSGDPAARGESRAWVAVTELAQVQQSDEKKRVPKEDEKKGESKPAAETQTESDDSCFGSCIDAFFLSIFSPDPEPETVVLPAVIVPPEAVGSPPSALGYGFIQHPDSVQTLVMVWDGPGGPDRGYALLGALTPGTEIAVTNTGGDAHADWIEVETLGDNRMGGWVTAEHVDWVARPATEAIAPATLAGGSTAAPEAEVPASPEIASVAAPTGPRNLAIMTEVSYLYLTGPSEVREEYENGGVHFGITGVFIPSGTLQLSLGIGFATIPGYPKYDYETSTVRESPIDSRLDILDLGLRAGQYGQIRQGRGRYYWGLGPVLYWVQETADLEIYALPTELPLGERTEVQDTWRFGADLGLGFSYAVARTVHLGGLARFFWIPWDGEGEKSLTLDFIGDKTLVGFNVGVSLAFDVF